MTMPVLYSIIPLTRLSHIVVNSRSQTKHRNGACSATNPPNILTSFRVIGSSPKQGNHRLSALSRQLSSKEKLQRQLDQPRRLGLQNLIERRRADVAVG